MKITITGASGLLGRRLMVKLLEGGHEVVAVCRNRETISELPSGNIFEWDALGGPFPENALQSVDAVIHLAGHPVGDGRWTEKTKSNILNSRTRGTKSLVDAISKMSTEKRPRVFLNGSAIGFYGSQSDQKLDESSAGGAGFLARVVMQLETESSRARTLGLRVVDLRTGVVLSRNGGALPKMPPFVLGSGKQWLSWIHIEDWLSGVCHILENSAVIGPLNLTATEPVTQEVFVQALRRVVSFPVRIRIPEIVLRATLGEMAELLLSSQRVVPQKLQSSGFNFRFNAIDSALEDLFGESSYLENEFLMWQFVPASVEAAFDFFSEAANLQKITPEWLHFNILKKSTPMIQENTVIDYRLRVHGYPLRWRSQILDWKPTESFVDLQLKGPYSRWHHLHTFKKVSGGTLIGDRVHYRVPGHIFGKILLSSFVARDVRKIFDFRRGRIERFFSNGRHES